MSRGFRTLMVAAITVMFAGGCASVGHRGITEANLDGKIERANTPTDHAALADYYDERAQQAQREGIALRGARRHYEHRPPGLYYPVGIAANILDHYDRLIEGYEQTEAESHALAAWHRRMADGGGGSAQ